MEYNKLHNDIEIVKSFLTDDNRKKLVVKQPFWKDIVALYKSLISKELKSLTVEECVSSYVSERNYFNRRKTTIKSSPDKKVYFDQKLDVKVGDIVITDFGKQYYTECTYIHPALVISIFDDKYLVIPMTSSLNTLHLASFWQKKNLMPMFYDNSAFSNIEKNSTLIINDFKWISSSRFVNNVGNMDIMSPEFKEIKRRMIELIVGDSYEANL